MRLSEDEYRALLKRNPDLQPEVLSRDPPIRPGGTLTLHSALEEKFMVIWQALDGPTLEREVRFDPKRKWRLDFLHRPTRIAIEIEGGVYGQGRHNRAQGFMADAEKYLAATLAGYTVLRLPPNLIHPTQLARIIEFVVGRLSATPPPSSQDSPGGAQTP